MTSPAEHDPQPGRPRRPRGVLARHWPEYVAISPFYLLFIVFGSIPVVFSMGLAFFRWNGMSELAFVGFDQFVFLLQDRLWWKSVANTLVIWVASTVPMLVMALVIAAVLNTVTRFRLFYQVILFLPSITSVVAIVVFFRAMFDQGYGVVNQTLVGIGLAPVAWFEDEWAIKAVLAMLMTWQWVGYNAIIYSAGLTAVPKELYEAASLDGANSWQQFRYVTVPLLRPIILFTVVMSTISGLQSFTEPQVLFSSNSTTNADSGGPGNAGLTMVLYFYNQAFTHSDYGYGSAIAWAVLVIVSIFSLINWRLVARSER